MIRLAIAGVAGRMGKMLVEAAREHPQLRVGAASESRGNAWVGRSLDIPGGYIQVVDDLHKVVEDFDVVIDFTSPQATLENMAICSANDKRLVIGTTGLSTIYERQLQESAQKIPIVYAPNMSVSVNLSFRLAEIAAQVLGDSVDVEIIEAHHRHKVDAPSGTALRLGRGVARMMGHDLLDNAVFSREGHTGPRKQGTIGFATIRAGDIVGEHTVLFAGEGERLEITHRASNRMTFAAGALRAALWLQLQGPGLYDMQDVLGLRELGPH